jgi:hypothetical protein
MSQQLDLKEFQDYLLTFEAVYAHDSKRKKRLVITGNGGFKIYDNKEVVWEGIQPLRAIEKYNSI